MHASRRLEKCWRCFRISGFRGDGFTDLRDATEKFSEPTNQKSKSLRILVLGFHKGLSDQHERGFGFGVANTGYKKTFSS
jgi:hypothetical protein